MQRIELHPWEVLGLLDGSVTQLVRPVVPKPPSYAKWSWRPGGDEKDLWEYYFDEGNPGGDYPYELHEVTCPFPNPGERFYVQEDHYWHPCEHCDPQASTFMRPGLCICGGDWIRYRADWECPGKDRCSWIFTEAKGMPEEFSRCKPEVVSVRLERIQDGHLRCVFPENEFPRFRKLVNHWNNDYPDLPWESNPWVWVAEVKT